MRARALVVSMRPLSTQRGQFSNAITEQPLSCLRHNLAVEGKRSFATSYVVRFLDTHEGFPGEGRFAPVI